MSYQKKSLSWQEAARQYNNNARAEAKRLYAIWKEGNIDRKVMATLVALASFFAPGGVFLKVASFCSGIAFTWFPEEEVPSVLIVPENPDNLTDAELSLYWNVLRRYCHSKVDYPVKTIPYTITIDMQKLHSQQKRLRNLYYIQRDI